MKSTVCGWDSHFSKIWNQGIRCHGKRDMHKNDSFLVKWFQVLELNGYNILYQNETNRRRSSTCLLLRSAVVISPFSKETKSCLCWPFFLPLHPHESLNDAFLPTILWLDLGLGPGTSSWRTSCENIPWFPQHSVWSDAGASSVSWLAIFPRLSSVELPQSAQCSNPVRFFSEGMIQFIGTHQNAFYSTTYGLSISGFIQWYYDTPCGQIRSATMGSML